MRIDPGDSRPGCNPFGPFLMLALQLAMWRGKRRRRRAAARRNAQTAAGAAESRQEPPSAVAAAPGSSWHTEAYRPSWEPRSQGWRSTADMWADSASVQAFINSRVLELTPWITTLGRMVAAYAVAVD